MSKKGYRDKMFSEYLETYMLKLENIKLIESTLTKNLPKNIKKELENYKDAILMDLYFTKLLEDKEDEKLEKKVLKDIEIIEIDKEKKSIRYNFKKRENSLNKHKDITEARKIISKNYLAMKTMYNNILISIIIEFETLLSAIWSNIINKFPEAYLTEKKITYTDIIKSKDMSEIKQTIIEQQVNEIMRENVFNWVKILKDKHNIKLLLDNNYIKTFIEAYYRRNIIVHNNAKINKDYINGLKKINNIVPEDKIGECLDCTKEYIEQVIDSALYIIIFIIYNLLPLFENEDKNFIDKISDVAFDKVKTKEYELAREIFSLVKNHKNISEQSRIYAKINFWQTYKWDNKYNEIREEIEEFDVSAYEDIIKLAIYSLREEFNKVEDILNLEFNEQKQNEDLAIQLEDFPVFQQLRKQKFYINIKEKYKEAFYSKESQPDENTKEKAEKMLKKDKDSFSITINIK